MNKKIAFPMALILTLLMVAPAGASECTAAIYQGCVPAIVAPVPCV